MLEAPESRGIFYLKNFPELRSLLEHFATQWCSRSTDGNCSHVAGIRLVVERTWFTDGFVSPPPSDYVGGADLFVNACPGRILGALNG